MRQGTYVLVDGKVKSRSLVLNVVKHCNLSCRGCGHLSPVYGKSAIPPEALQADLDVLTAYYHANETLILGGEPLLHPELLEILEVVKRSGVGDQVKVLTNGTLLGRMQSEFWQLVDEVRVSVYPGKEMPEAEKRKAAALAAQHDTSLSLQYYDQFRESVVELPTKDHELIKRIYDSCLIAHQWHCNTIESGFFYKCPQAFLLPSSHGTAGEQLAQEDGIRLRNEPGFARVLWSYLLDDTPLSACRQCLGTVGKLIPHEQVKRKDWRMLQMRQAQGLVDYEHMEALEKGLVTDVPAKLVTLVVHPRAAGGH
jgi:organic radical activating enzyme